MEASTAQQGPEVTLTARAGFDGRYKDGRWIPIRITVANDGPDVSGSLRIVAPFNYGSAETVYTRAVELPTQSRREIFLYIASDGFLSNLKVTLVDDDNKLKASRDVRLTQVGPNDILYGVDRKSVV